MSLSSIFAEMSEQDIVKEAEASGGEYYSDDTLEKAAEYDAIGRRFAHQVLAQQLGIEDFGKEAAGLPPALLAAAAEKAGAGAGDDEEDEGESPKKKKGHSDEEKEEMMEKMQEKKAAVVDAMYNDPEYLAYIVDKYVEFQE